MNTIPKAIKNLKLLFAFRGYHPSFQECIAVTNEKEFRIIDDEKSKCTCITTDADPSKCCVVLNPKGDEAVVLSIDNKLISNHKGGISDGAVFNISHFHFIEFKSNAMGHSLEQIKSTYDKAIDQLLETLNIFIKNISRTGLNFCEKTTISCHIVVSKEFPRSSATEQTCQLEFTLKTTKRFNYPVELDFEQSFDI